MNLKNNKKLSVLKDRIDEYGSAVIAFSGGVDSTFLAWAAKDVLGENLMLVTSASMLHPGFEIGEAEKLAEMMRVTHRVIVTDEISDPGVYNNPPQRCYHCKKRLMSIIKEIAAKEGYDAVFDGSNADDTEDFRPGRKALKEHEIISPLADAELTKKEIRDISEKAGLPTARKPSFACLASRMPYGEKITEEKLKRIEKTEDSLRGCGFFQFRVRDHGNIARIEFAENEMEKGWKERKRISEICRKNGYKYTAVDLEGYRTGSMNEVL